MAIDVTELSSTTIRVNGVLTTSPDSGWWRVAVIQQNEKSPITTGWVRLAEFELEEDARLFERALNGLLNASVEKLVEVAERLRARQFPMWRRMAPRDAALLFGADTGFTCPDCHQRGAIDNRLHLITQGLYKQDLFCPECEAMFSE